MRGREGGAEGLGGAGEGGGKQERESLVTKPDPAHPFLMSDSSQGPPLPLYDALLGFDTFPYLTEIPLSPSLPPSPLSPFPPSQTHMPCGHHMLLITHHHSKHTTNGRGGISGI